VDYGCTWKLARVAELRLFSTAAWANSKSSKRRLDLVLLRFPLELGFRFITDGLSGSDQ
jgi:hypothetical protein